RVVNDDLAGEVVDGCPRAPRGLVETDVDRARVQEKCQVAGHAGEVKGVAIDTGAGDVLDTAEIGQGVDIVAGAAPIRIIAGAAPPPSPPWRVASHCPA